MLGLVSNMFQLVSRYAIFMHSQDGLSDTVRFSALSADMLQASSLLIPRTSMSLARA